MQEIPYGLCQCGCGEKTTVAPYDRRQRGWVKGKPLRFVLGHVHRRNSPAYEEHDCGHDTPCWIWMRSKSSLGYGRWNDGRPAYRVMWIERHGSVPEGLELDHLCRVPSCVNPDHLEPVTHAENTRRGKSTKLTADQVREIRRSDETVMALARRFQMAKSTISNIKLGRGWPGVY